MRGISSSAANIAAGVICFTLVFAAATPTPARAQLTFACTPDNDLFKLCPDAKRFDTPAAAIDAAPQASGVLILADRYPDAGVDVPAELLDHAKRKKLRLYIEYPGDAGDVRTAKWERGVVASDFFGPALPKMRIVAPHDCRFVPLDPAGVPHLVIARVAGYDTAVYGLPKESFPLLVETADGHLIAATKLSGFVTGRFAPTAEWKHVWRTVLRKLDPKHEPPTLDHEPLVRPSNATDERAALARAAAFYLNSRLLITPDRRDEIHQLLRAGGEEIAPPSTEPAAPADGSLGMMEGYASHVRPDGSQMQRTPIRADCNAEAAMVLALDADHPRGRAVASNLLDYTFGPEMQSLGRLDPKHPAFGLIAWGAVAPAWQGGNYGDDNARVLLAAILASAAMNSDRWDEHVARGLLANLRTTGTLGFRGDRVDVGPLEVHGWRHFRDAKTVNYSPHFESGLWACYLWAYARTGEREFLDRTVTAIGMTMDAYPQRGWRWNDNMERSRMLLCLAWLVRVDDTPRHRAWLTSVASDLLEAQHESGAIADRLANAGGGHYQIPRANEAYGTTETPLIHENGDPVSDQLYATGFALLGLHEAVGATGDEKLRAAADKLAAYLCRIQVRSEKLPYLDGGWFRAFDFGRWDFYASSADLGWGAWSVEAGWGPAWTAATLALRERRTTMWELTASSRVKDRLARVRDDMAKNDGSPR